jgi:hypothetical protein
MPEIPGRNAGTVVPLTSVTCTRVTAPLLRTVTVTVRPGSPESTVPDAVGHQLADQENHRLPRRVLPPEHCHRERRATATRSGRPATVTLSPAAPAMPTPPLPQPPAAPPPPGAAQKGHGLRASRETRPPSTLHSPARVKATPARRPPRGRQGQHRPSTPTGNYRKQPGPTERNRHRRESSSSLAQPPAVGGSAGRSQVSGQTSAFQQLPRHDHPLDLVRPLVDLGGRGPGGSLPR